MQRRPTPTLLISPNPLYFEAEEADRLDENTYRIRKGWLTVCKPGKPVWKFYAPAATVRLKQSVRIENGNFRVYSVPVLYLPYATVPAEKRRDSGFMIPEIGDTSQKGFVLGDSVYWAPLDWMDMTLGAADYSKRGWSQKGEFRMKPWEGATFDASYYGVIDRGLKVDDEPPLPQGGHEAKLLFTSDLPGGWRAVADLDQLTSLTFPPGMVGDFQGSGQFRSAQHGVPEQQFRRLQRRLRGAELSKLSHRHSADFHHAAHGAGSAHQFRGPEFFQQAAILLVIRRVYGRELSRGRDHAVFKLRDSSSAAKSRRPSRCRCTVGDWINVTPSFTFRSTYYGAQLRNGSFLRSGIVPRHRGILDRPAVPGDRARLRSRRYEMEARRRAVSGLSAGEWRE